MTDAATVAKAQAARWGRAISLLACALAVAAASATAEVVPGQPAPDFDLPRLDAPTTLRLSDLEGGWVYLDFWASWCAPCREAFPWMNRLSKGPAPGGLRIVAVGLDRDHANAMAFLRRHEPAFIVAWDGDWRVPEAYGFKILPASYLIDPDGIVRYVQQGYSRDDLQSLRGRLARIISATQD